MLFYVVATESTPGPLNRDLVSRMTYQNHRRAFIYQEAGLSFVNSFLVQPMIIL